MSRLVFVTGAARSGKSRYAEALAASLAGGEPVLYVATAAPGDDEMRRRVEEHRRRRPREWPTLEAPRGVAARLRRADVPGVVLLDCLSLLVSNVLLDAMNGLGDGAGAEQRASVEARDEVDALVRWRDESGRGLVVVSNEVGWGVVPPYRLGRVYRDLLGQANQRVAAAAAEAVLMVAGIPVSLKSGGFPETYPNAPAG